MNTSKENISAIIPMDKFENINEVIKSLIDIVAEIILINSSNNTDKNSLPDDEKTSSNDSILGFSKIVSRLVSLVEI